MEQQVFALKNSKEILRKSSSGGAFLAIAKTLFDMNNGNLFVYGVILDENVQPLYCAATTYEECEKFSGSKYIYVSIIDVIDDISQKLISGHSVLVCGTPCNIYTLKRNLHKNNISENGLYTVDLVCNGTPSVKFWNEYVKWIEKKIGSKLLDFKFRKKGDIYNPYLTEAEFENGQLLHDVNLTACYNQLFLKKLSIRKGCFSCRFKSICRVSDITIGDFWGIDKVLPEFIDKEEVSQMLVNTEKGKIILSGFDSEIKIMQCFNDDYLIYQKNLVSATPIPDLYDVFWSEYSLYGVDYVLKKYSDAGYWGKYIYFFRKKMRKFKKR